MTVGYLILYSYHFYLPNMLNAYKYTLAVEQLRVAGNAAIVAFRHKLCSMFGGGISSVPNVDKLPGIVDFVQHIIHFQKGMCQLN